jgi:oxygen-independent coproporphyrinogen-3 oxidase
MGVQSLDDATLREMNRGYSLAEARHAFARVKSVFPNAGIDLIVGYPGDTPLQTLPLKDWDLAHCSVYSLILEEKSLLSRQLKKHPALAAILPDDPTVLDAIRRYARSLREIGLERYEISNYARADTPCRHNLAVWRGEDYYGLGEGACGRIGRWRTRHWWGQPLSVKNGDTPRAAPPPTEGHAPEIETVDGDFDEKERTLFRLRTKEGLDTTGHADWLPILARAAANGLVKKDGPVYRLTERGTEVCDALLAELI